MSTGFDFGARVTADLGVPRGPYLYTDSLYDRQHESFQGEVKSKYIHSKHIPGQNELEPAVKLHFYFENMQLS